jgi:phosphatidylserine/phosphatidylglycerophosphate/cardiolipin synthase-like enzyme
MPSSRFIDAGAGFLTLLLASAGLSCAHVRSEREGTLVRAPAGIAQKPIPEMELAESLSASKSASATRFTGLPDTDYRATRGLYDHPSTAERQQQPPALQLVEGARKTLDIEIYEMKDREFLNAVSRAVDRGVRVRVIKDPKPIGDTCDLFPSGSPEGEEENDGTSDEASDSVAQAKTDPICTATQELKAKIIRSGGTFVRFNRPLLCGKDDETKPSKRCFQHGKLLITDARTLFPRALLSTGNFNSSSFCRAEASKCNRDFSFVTRNRAEVRKLARIFEADLRGERYALKRESLDRGPRTITVSPYSSEPLVGFLRSAKRRIQIANQYLRENSLQDALIQASQRGVKVEATVSALCAFTSRLTKKQADKAKVETAPLLEAGVQMRYFTKKRRLADNEGYLHAKAIVIDGERAWIGSVNGSHEGVNRNREFGIFFRKPSEVRELSAILAEDHAHPNTVSFEEALECKTLRESASE